jgi:hypothetical protein
VIPGLLIALPHAVEGFGGASVPFLLRKPDVGDLGFTPVLQVVTVEPAQGMAGVGRVIYTLSVEDITELRRIRIEDDDGSAYSSARNTGRGTRPSSSSLPTRMIRSLMRVSQ